LESASPMGLADVLETMADAGCKWREMFEGDSDVPNDLRMRDAMNSLFA
jgi:hypothetical protein